MRVGWRRQGHQALHQPPKSYGVEGLAFRLADGATRRFTAAGQLFFSDWRFEVFSRDCQWVALLVDHSGPYHLVRTAQLAGYLDGAVAPVVLQAKGEEASVHGDGRWTEDGRFEFTASCCGGAKALRATTAGEVSRPATRRRRDMTGWSASARSCFIETPLGNMRPSTVAQAGEPMTAFVPRAESLTTDGKPRRTKQSPP